MANNAKLTTKRILSEISDFATSRRVYTRQRPVAQNRSAWATESALGESSSDELSQTVRWLQVKL